LYSEQGYAGRGTYTFRAGIWRDLDEIQRDNDEEGLKKYTDTEIQSDLSIEGQGYKGTEIQNDGCLGNIYNVHGMRKKEGYRRKG